MNNKKSVLLFFCFLSFLAFTYPFVFQLFLPLPPISLLIPLTFLLYSVFVNKKGTILSHPIAKIAIFQLLSTILSLLISMDSEYIKQFLYIMWAICFISLLEQYGIYKFLFYYNRFILAVGVLGCISFVLSLIFGVHSFLSFPSGGSKFIDLVYFTFTNSIHGDYIRYGGVFDEPGAMAFWGMFALVTNKIYVKDSIEKPLIVTLFFTFSLGFYFQLLFYFFFFYVLNKFSIRRGLIAFTVLFVSVTYILSLDESSYLRRVTLSRVGIGSDVDFVNDNNRASYMDAAYPLFKNSPWFGVGPTVVKEQEAVDNPFETLARDGIVGAFFIYLPLFFPVFYSKFNRKILFAAFILFVGYLQRPFHFQFMHYTMLYIFLVICVSLVRKDRYCRLRYDIV